MRVRAGQHKYTSVAGDRMSGYQTIAASPALKPLLPKLVHCAGLGGELPLRHQFVEAWSCIPLEGGLALGKVVVKGTDFAGRPNRLLTHQVMLSAEAAATVGFNPFRVLPQVPFDQEDRVRGDLPDLEVEVPDGELELDPAALLAAVGGAEPLAQVLAAIARGPVVLAGHDTWPEWLAFLWQLFPVSQRAELSFASSWLTTVGRPVRICCVPKWLGDPATERFPGERFPSPGLPAAPFAEYVADLMVRGDLRPLADLHGRLERRKLPLGNPAVTRLVAALSWRPRSSHDVSEMLDRLAGVQPTTTEELEDELLCLGPLVADAVRRADEAVLRKALQVATEVISRAAVPPPLDAVEQVATLARALAQKAPVALAQMLPELRKYAKVMQTHEITVHPEEWVAEQADAIVRQMAPRGDPTLVEFLRGIGDTEKRVRLLATALALTREPREALRLLDAMLVPAGTAQGAGRKAPDKSLAEMLRRVLAAMPEGAGAALRNGLWARHMRLRFTAEPEQEIVRVLAEACAKHRPAEIFGLLAEPVGWPGHGILRLRRAVLAEAFAAHPKRQELAEAWLAEVEQHGGGGQLEGHRATDAACAVVDYLLGSGGEVRLYDFVKRPDTPHSADFLHHLFQRLIQAPSAVDQRDIDLIVERALGVANDTQVAKFLVEHGEAACVDNPLVLRRLVRRASRVSCPETRVTAWLASHKPRLSLDAPRAESRAAPQAPGPLPPRQRAPARPPLPVPEARGEPHPPNSLSPAQPRPSLPLSLDGRRRKALPRNLLTFALIVLALCAIVLGLPRLLGRRDSAAPGGEAVKQTTSLEPAPPKPPPVPPSPTAPPDTSEDEAEAKAAIEEADYVAECGDPVGAQHTLSALLQRNVPGVNPKEVKDRLKQLSDRVFFSEEVFPPICSRHQVTSGETVLGLAKKNRTTADLICRINGVDNKDKIIVGQSLKIIPGGFDILVDTRARRLTVTKKGIWVREFPVAIVGEGPPGGPFKESVKTGAHSIIVVQGYSIHGAAGAGQGGVQMRDEDLEWLIPLIVTGDSTIHVGPPRPEH